MFWVFWLQLVFQSGKCSEIGLLHKRRSKIIWEMNFISAPSSSNEPCLSSAKSGIFTDLIVGTKL